ncbi:MAG: TlpA disulfide reductase family protein [Pseudomonadota bacterium]
MKMTASRTTIMLVGAMALGVAAGAAYRSMTSPDKSAASASTAGAMLRGSGSVLPDLRFTDGAGAPRALSDFRGRVVLLNLWATWCTPCREEMPALDRLQAALGGPGFEVVALSLDREGLEIVKRFYKELDLRALRIYVDPNGDALGKLGGMGIPLTMLVDRDGRELWRVLGPRQWDQPAEANRIREHLARAPNG